MTKEELFRAVGEVREDQITDAETMKKQSRPWRRYGALAACLAVVLAAALALERLEEARKWAEIEGSFDPLARPESAQDAGGAAAGGAEQKRFPEEEPGAGDLPDGADYWNSCGARPAPHYSDNVELGELGARAADDVVMDEEKNRTETNASACLVWLSPEEVFAQDTVIFRGVVESSPRYYRIEMPGRDYYYCTVVSVRVADSIRGGLEEEEVYSLMYSGAKGYMSLSTSGPLERLEAGSEAIFMAERTGPDTGWRTETGYFCYADLAELRIGEGIRFVFLDTGDGLDFSRSTYGEIADAETLDEVADYVRRMTGGEQGRPAAVPAEPQPAPSYTAQADGPSGGPAGARELPGGALAEDGEKD